MSPFQKFARLSAVAAAVIVAAPAFAAATVDANAEFDTGVANNGGGSSQGGRIETNISGKAEANGGFVAGRGTIIAYLNGGALGGNNGAAVDDAWVQAGTAAFDVKMGRWEAADLYPTPGDVFRFGNGYQTNNLRGRSLLTAGGGGVDDRLHIALTANLAAGVSLEIGVVDKKDVSAAGALGFKGVRPALSFTAGALTARVGLESGKTADVAGSTNEVSFTGFGGTVSAAVGGGVTLRANFANGTTSYTAGDKKQSAFLIGADVGALNLSVETSKDEQGASTTKRTGLFAAYGIPLFGIKGATLSPAIGFQSVDTTGLAKVNNNKVGARVHYDF
ncbi:MAG: carbohydrate porin [Leptothrix sp. (in: b-proteobacteria)]